VFIYKAILGACRILHSILGLKVISLSLSLSLSLYIYIWNTAYKVYIRHISSRGCNVATCVVGLLSKRGCKRMHPLFDMCRWVAVQQRMHRWVAMQAQDMQRWVAHATLPSVLGVEMQAQHGTACTAQQAACIKSIKSMHQEHVPRPHVTPCVYLYICTCIRRVMPRPVGRLLIHTHTHTHTYTHTCNILVYAVCNLYIYIVYICICMCVCI